MLERIRTNINSLKTITTEQWRNRLETDYEGVSFQLTEDEKYLETFNSVPRHIRQSILSSYGIENERDLPTPLHDAFKIDVKVLGILKELLSKLNRDVTLQYLRTYLEEEGTWNHVEQVGQISKLILAILLLENLNLEKLHRSLLVSRYERFGYQDYQLFLDLEGVQDPLIQAEYKEIERRGINNAQITEDVVNLILDRFERANTTRLSSVCLKVLNYNDEIVVFILRESQRGGLRTFQEYIVGWNADLIVLRFELSLRTLKVRAVDAVKEDVYISIASNIIKNSNPQLPINYIKSSFANPKEVVDVLLQALLENNIPGVELYEIDLRSTPFEGRPNIFIQKNSEDIPLTNSFNDNTNGFTLSTIITTSKVSRVKVTYTTNRRHKHIFNLKILESNNQYYILISGQGGGIGKRLSLIQKFKDLTGARILETKEN